MGAEGIDDGPDTTRSGPGATLAPCYGDTTAGPDVQVVGASITPQERLEAMTPEERKALSRWIAGRFIRAIEALYQ